MIDTESTITLASKFRLSLLAAFLVLVSGGYALATVVHVAPDSPATSRLRSTTERLTTPFFQQKWTLFAPDPIDVNYETLFSVRFKVPNQGVRETGRFNLTKALQRIYRTHGLLLPRVNYVAATLESTLLRPTEAEIRERRLQRFRPEFSLPPEAREYLADRKARIVQALTRLVSTAADQLPELNGTIVTDVRFVIVETPVVRFRDRYRRSQTPLATTLRYDSGWLPYIRGVTPW